MNYRVLYDRYILNHNKNLIYNNKIVAGLSFYVRIKILDNKGKDLFLRKISKYDYCDITTNFSDCIHFSIDNKNKLMSINLCRSIINYFNLNKNIEYINVSLTDFAIELFTDNSCIVCEPYIVSEKEFINFLIDNHINFEITDNIDVQSSSYTIEEVKQE